MLRTNLPVLEPGPAGNFTRRIFEQAFLVAGTHDSLPTYIYIYIIIIKPTKCTNFSNLFWKRNSTYFGQFLCPKNVKFHFQNKLEKLVHPVGVITRKFLTEHGYMNVNIYIYIYIHIYI
jgi:hypothetical protein